MKVSILCTAYNHEKYIANALDSFLAQQTDFPFEIIVTDDASTDNTPAILREYAELYPDVVKYFHQERNLFSQGINTIYETVMYPNATGEYIAFCEGDDYWCDNTKLAQQISFLDSHKDYSACTHNSYYHYCDDNKTDELIIPPSSNRDISFATIITGLHRSFHTSSIVARREFITNSPDFVKTASIFGFLDYPWSINLALNGKIHYIDKPMSVYRLNSIAESWSSGYDYDYTKKTRFVMGEIAMMKNLLTHVNGENKSLVENELLKREYELSYLQGNVKQLISKTYLKLFLKESFSFKVKTLLKLIFPRAHAKYRLKQGYDNE